MVALGDAHLHLAGVTPAGAGHGLFLLPGYTDHLGRYTDFFNFFADRGDAVWAMDPRGHGLSAGRRGYVRCFSDYLDDLQQAIFTARERSGVKRWTLVGHSTGGLVVLSALVRRQAALNRWGVERAVVTSPLLAIRLPVTPVKRRLGQVASAVAPWLSLPGGGDDYANSHDPDQEARRRTDPLIFKWVNARWFTAVQGEMDFLRGRGAEVTMPLLALQAGADRVVEPSATQAWMADCPTADYHAFDDMYHEVLLETERQQVFQHIADWVLGAQVRGARP
jgi:lysophospholipase